MKTVKNYLICDTLECSNFVIVPDIPNREFIQARKLLGWTREAKEDKDYCPNCSNPELTRLVHLEQSKTS